MIFPTGLTCNPERIIKLKPHRLLTLESRRDSKNLKAALPGKRGQQGLGFKIKNGSHATSVDKLLYMSASFACKTW